MPHHDEHSPFPKGQKYPLSQAADAATKATMSPEEQMAHTDFHMHPEISEPVRNKLAAGEPGMLAAYHVR